MAYDDHKVQGADCIAHDQGFKAFKTEKLDRLMKAATCAELPCCGQARRDSGILIV